MRKKLRYVRLSAEEERDLEALSMKWGCQRCEVLRYTFRAFLLGLQGRNLDTGKAAAEQATNRS
jgi:hypothetical protein